MTIGTKAKDKATLLQAKAAAITVVACRGMPGALPWRKSKMRLTTSTNAETGTRNAAAPTKTADAAKERRCIRRQGNCTMKIRFAKTVIADDDDDTVDDNDGGYKSSGRPLN